MLAVILPCDCSTRMETSSVLKWTLKMGSASSALVTLMACSELSVMASRSYRIQFTIQSSRIVDMEMLLMVTRGIFLSMVVDTTPSFWAVTAMCTALLVCTVFH
jgi:hypothetical protein